MMYCYVLGCAIACLCLTAVGSMETVNVKPAEIVVKTLLWPVTLCRAIARNASMKRLNAAR